MHAPKSAFRKLVAAAAICIAVVCPRKAAFAAGRADRAPERLTAEQIIAGTRFTPCYIKSVRSFPLPLDLKDREPPSDRDLALHWDGLYIVGILKTPWVSRKSDGVRKLADNVIEARDDLGTKLYPRRRRSRTRAHGGTYAPKFDRQFLARVWVSGDVRNQHRLKLGMDRPPPEATRLALVRAQDLLHAADGVSATVPIVLKDIPLEPTWAPPNPAVPTEDNAPDPSFNDEAAKRKAEGFIVNAVAVRYVSYRLMPGCDGIFGDEERDDLLRDAAGLVVRCELFLPEGHTLLETSGARAIDCVDDWGRTTRAAHVDWKKEDNRVPLLVRDRLYFDLILPRPSDNARKLLQVRGEVRIDTCIEWKTLVIPEEKMGLDNPIDMGHILPGATIAVRKNRAASYSLHVTGTEGLELVDDFLCSYRHGDGKESTLRWGGGGGGMSRKTGRFGIWSHHHGSGSLTNPTTPPVDPALVIRVPAEPRRLTVPFDLRGIPLYEPEPSPAER